MSLREASGKAGGAKKKQSVKPEEMGGAKKKQSAVPNEMGVVGGAQERGKKQSQENRESAAPRRSKKKSDDPIGDPDDYPAE